MFSFGVLASLTLAQIPHVGKCPVVETQSTLNVTQYLGKWYEIQKFPAIFEKGSCVRAEYSLKSNGRVKVDNRYIENGYETHAIGEAWVPDPNHPAVLNVQFNPAIPPAQYKVIETDYESYSLVFSCEDVGGFIDFQFAWILSKKLTLPEELVNRLKQKLQSYQVDVSAFIVSDQNNCPM